MGNNKRNRKSWISPKRKLSNKDVGFGESSDQFSSEENLDIEAAALQLFNNMFLEAFE